MRKTKFLFFLFISIILFFNTFCFAADNDEIMLISNDNGIQSDSSNDIQYSDLYISQDGEYTIKNTIIGNAFIKVDTFNIDSSNNGGIISGNLYVSADTVNIKSDFKYSETEKDELGNYKLESVNNFSKIDGNVFVVADKFTLEPNCEISGDLYVYANEIKLSQSSIVRGNVFAMGNTLNLNAEISSGDFYADVDNFNMKYYGFIYRDLHLSAENANLEGYIYRNSFIDATNITTTSTFINNKDFNVENALNTTFSGEIKGNANINSKNIDFKSKDENGKNLYCLISGNLNYSTTNEIQIEDKIVSGTINYRKYKSSNNLLSNILNISLELLTSLIFVIIIYFILSKVTPNFIENLSEFNFSGIFKYLGISLLVLIIVPILSVLLLITRIGSLLGILLAIIYVLLLIIAKPIFVITISKIINNKFASINTYIAIIITSILLSLISLIPFAGSIIFLLILFAGLVLTLKCFKN